MRAAVVLALLATPVLAAGLTDNGSESDQFWSRSQRVGPNSQAYPDKSAAGTPQGRRQDPTRHATPQPGYLLLPPEADGVAQGIDIQAASPAVDQLQAFPMFDVETACREAYPHEQSYKVCIQREQGAYDTARLFWDRVGLQAHQRCQRTAREASRGMGRHAFYSVLMNCLSGEVMAGQSRAPAPRFRY